MRYYLLLPVLGTPAVYGPYGTMTVIITQFIFNTSLIIKQSEAVEIV